MAEVKMTKKVTNEAAYTVRDFVNAKNVFEQNPDVVRAAFFNMDFDKTITEDEAKKIVSDFATKKIK